MHMNDVMSRDTAIHAHLLQMRDRGIGARIVRARKAAGIGQAELARRLGVTAVTVFRWEKGTAEAPLPRLRKISEITGIPIDELIPDLETDNDVPEVPDDPEAHIRLAQLALAAARSPDDDNAKRRLNEAVLERAKALRARMLHASSKD